MFQGTEGLQVCSCFTKTKLIGNRVYSNFFPIKEINQFTWDM